MQQKKKYNGQFNKKNDNKGGYRERNRDKKQSVPMPEIDSVLNPADPDGQITYWHKDIPPRGIFSRILFQNGKHVCACDHNHTQGIVVFLDKIPSPWDNIRITDSGEKTCRGTPVNKYSHILHKIEDMYLSDGNESLISDVMYSVLEDKDLCGFDYSTLSEYEQLRLEAFLFIGCSEILAYNVSESEQESD